MARPAHPVDAELTHRIRECCKGLTKAEVARRTRINAESVRRYMEGDRPSCQFLVAIATKLNVSPNWLLLGRGRMFRSVQDPQSPPALSSAELSHKPASAVEHNGSLPKLLRKVDSTRAAMNGAQHARP